MINHIRTTSFTLFLLLGFSAICSSASGQTRVSDNDLERLMKNLRDDAKSFRPVFESSLKRSTIRKTSQEKDAKKLAEQFAKQTDGAWQQFKKTKQNHVGITNVSATAQQIDKLVYGLKLDGSTTSAWSKIQQELQQVQSAFGIQTSLPANNASLYSSAGGASCRLSVGEERSKRLVEECSNVSPATHPPCNAENSCTLIIDEIKRSCALLGRDAPHYCLEDK
jgi:hypothetical protein